MDVPGVTCTYGPSCTDLGTLTAMRDAGMQCCRLNTAYGEPKDWEVVMGMMNGLKVPVMLDLKGRQLRFTSVPMQVIEGETVIIGYGKGAIALNHDLSSFAPGDEVRLENGLVMRLREARQDHAVFETVTCGWLRSQRAAASRQLPAVSLTDRTAIESGRKYGARYLLLSEVERPDDLLELQAIVRQQWSAGDKPVLGAKVESAAAVRNLDGIVKGCQLAQLPVYLVLGRGDLRTEVAYDVVPVVQKGVAAYCRTTQTPLVVATKMLESMLAAPDPSQSDCSDVANAILEGCAGVMLTDETAIGKYPVEATRVAARVVQTAKAALTSGKPYEQLMADLLKP
jgi:pyruvate kinase